VVELRIELALLAGEGQTFGGCVFLDGRPIGKLPPFRGGGPGGVREFAFRFDSRGGTGRLDIDSNCEGIRHELRIARVRAAESGYFDQDRGGPAESAPRGAEVVASR
jgi:hypothetical protein